VKSGYLVGNSFTLADMDFMPILYYMTKFPESGELVNAHPNLKAYFERHVTRKSVQESIPQSAPGTAGEKTEQVNVARAVNA
jgi:glutathione S-transferase